MNKKIFLILLSSTFLLTSVETLAACVNKGTPSCNGVSIFTNQIGCQGGKFTADADALSGQCKGTYEGLALILYCADLQAGGVQTFQHYLDKVGKTDNDFN